MVVSCDVGGAKGENMYKVSRCERESRVRRPGGSGRLVWSQMEQSLLLLYVWNKMASQLKLISNILDNLTFSGNINNPNALQ